MTQRRGRRRALVTSTIHFIGGEKGGVGKSVLSRLLSQYFIDRALPFSGIDADESHRALSRYYRDYTQAADLKTYASADQIMDRALGADRRVLVDLPAQSAQALAGWIEASDVLRFAEEMSVRLVELRAPAARHLPRRPSGGDARSTPSGPA